MKEYLLSDSIIPYTSVICGICACMVVYDLIQLFCNVYFKSYPSLSKINQIEWCNRSISTFQAIFIAIMSLYLCFGENSILTTNMLTWLLFEVLHCLRSRWG